MSESTLGKDDSDLKKNHGNLKICGEQGSQDENALPQRPHSSIGCHKNTNLLDFPSNQAPRSKSQPSLETIEKISTHAQCGAKIGNKVLMRKTTPAQLPKLERLKVKKNAPTSELMEEEEEGEEEEKDDEIVVGAVGGQ
ncbi:uncharacterized protein LOC141915235 [Tubulanus polymorphus]|uniref:uncharacterized protein LOC141915235 n=1 Tax=Tubulanus polymorphus TaxID=672921 RepID=UPI003DA64257